MEPTLADALREGTKALHIEVERRPFVKAMLKKRLPPGAYAAFLRNLHALYGAIESAVEHHRDHPRVRPIYEPALFRTEALAVDLCTHHGEDWEALPVDAVMHEYVARIRELESSQPELLVAHVYVRSLGDLNGGRVLQKIVGGAFYELGTPETVARLSHALRDGISSLRPDEKSTAAIVGEAQYSFREHGRLFDSLSLQFPT